MMAIAAQAHTISSKNRPAQTAHDREELAFVLAAVSHELRRPLTAILGWTRMLRSGRSTDVARALEVIERSANQQRLLIEELLDLSRTTPQDPEASFSAVDLNNVLLNVADAAQPAAAEKKLQLVHKPASHPLTVRGDVRRLHQIFGNLVANAIKFTPEGGRIIVASSRLGCDAVIEVADTGVGIDPADVPRIFEPFWQADAPRRLSQGGLGLGLAIVQRFVELHGGAIEARSAGSGSGTCMVVRLPLEAWHKT